jgi:hypothetical protein
VRALELLGVQPGTQLTGEAGDVEHARRPVAAVPAGQIDGDHAPPVGEDSCERDEVPRRDAEPVQEHDDVARAHFADVEPDPVDEGESRFDR